MDISIGKDEVHAKNFDKGKSYGQKRKVEKWFVEVPQRNLRLSGPLCSFQQSPGRAGDTTREKPLCNTCGRLHLGRCLGGTRVCFKYRQEGHMVDRCPLRFTKTRQSSQRVRAPHRGTSLPLVD